MSNSYIFTSNMYFKNMVWTMCKFKFCVFMFSNLLASHSFLNDRVKWISFNMSLSHTHTHTEWITQRANRANTNMWMCTWIAPLWENQTCNYCFSVTQHMVWGVLSPESGTTPLWFSWTSVFNYHPPSMNIWARQYLVYSVYIESMGIQPTNSVEKDPIANM